MQWTWPRWSMGGIAAGVLALLLSAAWARAALPRTGMASAPTGCTRSGRSHIYGEVRPLDKLIITAAVTGSVTIPTQTPHLPITPGAIATDAIACARAGAAAVHLHARDPRNGRPSALRAKSPNPVSWMYARSMS